MSKLNELKSMISTLSGERKRVIDTLGTELLPVEHFYDDEKGRFDRLGYEKYLDSMVLVADARDLEMQKRTHFYDPKYTLGVVLNVTGVKKATLRNWLTRKQIELDADNAHNTDKWRLFSARDAMHIAVLNSLAHLGLSIVDAGAISKPIMKLIEGMSTRISDFAGPPVLYFWKVDGEWRSGMSFDTQNGEITSDAIPAAAIAVRTVSIVEHVLGGLSSSENQ